MEISRRLLPFAAFLALAFAGCGGGDDGDSTAAGPEITEVTTALSKEELIAQGDAICAEVNAAVGTIGSTSSGVEGQAAQVADLYGGMVERLHGPRRAQRRQRRLRRIHRRRAKRSRRPRTTSRSPPSGKKAKR